MAYHSLWLQNFRSYRDDSIEFTPGVNIIVGPNGSGKTNLLEALYVLSQGASFRVADKDLVRYNASGFRLEGLQEQQRRILAYSPHGPGPTKQFSLDGVKKQRLSYQQRVPVVLFEPDELRLLTGSPSRRRVYMDTLLAQLWPEAARLKNQFERALLQRNNILKHSQHTAPRVLEDRLFVWNIKLAEYAAGLVARRLEVARRYNQRIADLYASIAQHPSEVEVCYQTDISLANYKSNLLQQLITHSAADAQRGFTSAGPHRDDFSIMLNGKPAAVSASRGETRTLVLVLKMIELELLAQQHDRPPLLLLDDVFSELDAARRQALARLSRQYQTIITTTDADAIIKHFLEADYNIIATG